MAPAGPLTLTLDVVVNRAGILDVLTLKELILRDEALTQVEVTCAQSLASLEILSLSHNRLTSLDSFQYLVNLVELNVNFNQIKTLDGLQCAGLEKLFLANNCIVELSPLRKFLKLNTLSVYGNRILDLDAALHTCRSLPKLRSLDLGGNPCANVEGYKFRVLRALSRLETLDGDHLTQLDKELTEKFFASVPKSLEADNKWKIGARPVTAPAGRGYSATTFSTRTDPFASRLMPRGNVRLFRDDFFNNNPILLEYLAQDAGTVPTLQERNDNIDNNALQSNFVDKMRSANPLSKSDMEATDVDAEDSTSTIRLNLSSNPVPSHLEVDPSDPNITIRKLLKHIEILMETLSKYKNRRFDAVNDSLGEEIKQLQTENNNIPLLQEQIHDLKKQVARLESDPGKRDMDAAITIQSLAQQNARLQQENARLNELLKERNESNDDAITAETHTFQRFSHSPLLDESALIDVELTELILQNEISLKLIRNDIKNTQKEWNDEYQQAKSRHQRPQTSMGLESSPSSLYTSHKVAQRASQDRRLHTSTGFRHGPNAQLLQSPSINPSTSARSPTNNAHSNILTL